MHGSRVTVEFTWPIELSIECRIGPAHRGQCVGPPERCSKPEAGEFEVLGIECTSEPNHDVCRALEKIFGSPGVWHGVCEEIEREAREMADGQEGW